MPFFTFGMKLMVTEIDTYIWMYLSIFLNTIQGISLFSQITVLVKTEINLLLLYFSFLIPKVNQRIFLEKEHTYIECDSMYPTIERDRCYKIFLQLAND